MKINISFIDEDRPEIELNMNELVEEPAIADGFLWITYNDKSTRVINTNLISEIVTG